MAKKFHNSPFPSGETNYGMPMGSHIKNVSDSSIFKNEAEKPSIEAIDKTIDKNISKLNSQKHNR